eukprot:2958140-Pleurochrysis_carterae.AAC.2
MSRFPIPVYCGGVAGIGDVARLPGGGSVKVTPTVPCAANRDVNLEANVEAQLVCRHDACKQEPL